MACEEIGVRNHMAFNEKITIFFFVLRSLVNIIYAYTITKDNKIVVIGVIL
jgi:hypothetical protein